MSVARRSVGFAIGLAVIGGAAAGGCGRVRHPSAPTTVVLITVDTLRADRLGAYGSATTETPVLDALAREGTLYEHAAAVMPITRPSHMSILTSLYPRSHGVVNNVLDLPKDVVTVAEVLHRAGFRTAGVVSVSLLAAGSGAERGFETFDWPQGNRERPAEQSVPVALRWIEGLAPGERAFLWLHLFDPHMPYEVPGLEVRAGEIASISWDFLETTSEANAGDLPASLLERGKYLYDRQVEYTDAWLGHLFDGLRAAGRWDDSLIVLTADHGECFENGVFFEHTDCLFDGAIHVPLIARAPGWIAAGRRVGEQVESLDIAPTLLDILGLEAPAQFAGRSLRAERPVAPAFLQFPVYSNVQLARRIERRDRIRSVGGEPSRPAVVEGDLLGLRTPDLKYFQGPFGDELYDLAQDPVERRNLATSDAIRPGPLLETTRQQVEAWRAEHPLRVLDSGEVPEELLEQLRALGYVR